MPEEELNDEEVEETLPEESSEEATAEETAEEEKETEKEPSKEVPQEYTKERFDGLMSAWQKDRKDMLTLKEEVENIKKAQQPQESKDRIWMRYLRDGIKKIDAEEQTKGNQVAEAELEQVSMANPDLDKKAILDTAIAYGEEGHQINLATAARILRDIQSGVKTTRSLTAEEIARKKSAGKIAGKPGGILKAGLRAYDAQKDKGKRPEELMEEGLKELGIK